MLNKFLIKFKGLFPTKFKTFCKKFRKFNGYDGLDKRMLKYINYSNGFYIECGANDGVNQLIHSLKNTSMERYFNRTS